MAETTEIAWADSTWSPWEGCTKVSPGCDHCYAEGMNRWLRKGENWGPGAPRREYSEDHWKKPPRWNAAAEKAGRRIKVFPSVCDPFDNAVDPAWRARFFALIACTPHLTWLLLTKRIGNVATMIEAPGMQKCGLPENVWLGATVVNQEEADRDIPKLLATPACVRFLSIEPMLGPVELRGPVQGCGDCDPCIGGREDQCAVGALRTAALYPGGIDWVICGGESGRGARPMHPDWTRSLRDQCAAAGVPFLFKQHGEWLPINQQAEDFTNRLYRSNRVAKLHQDQSALDDSYGRRCIVPTAVIHRDGSVHDPLQPMAFLQGAGAMQTFNVGKKAAGRLLDGVKHDGFPEVQQ